MSGDNVNRPQKYVRDSYRERPAKYGDKKHKTRKTEPPDPEKFECYNKYKFNLQQFMQSIIK